LKYSNCKDTIKEERKIEKSNLRDKRKKTTKRLDKKVSSNIMYIIIVKINPKSSKISFVGNETILKSDFLSGMDINILTLILDSLYKDALADTDEKVFEMKLKTKCFTSLNGGEKEAIKIVILIVDDEFMIRNANLRQLIKQCSEIKENINLTVVEADDGIECLSAMYLSIQNHIKINAIISDENMKYMNGSVCSKIMQEIIINGKFDDTPMFICSAISHTNMQSKFSRMVKQIYSKPFDKKDALEVLKQCYQSNEV